MFYEFQHSGVSERFTKEYGENFDFSPHLHSSFEFITIMSGEMEISVDDTSYHLKKGDSLLVFPNQLHSFKSLGGEHMLCIFSPERVKAYSLKVSHLLPKSNKFSPDPYLIDILDKIQDDSSSIEQKGLLYLLCSEFDKNAEYEERAYGDKDLLYKIFNFVELNYNIECSLEELASRTGYSYSYLSRFFKRMTGISFNTYVNHFRIKNACYLLKNSDDTVLQCALESGYRSLRSFNRNFISIMRLTPKEFREQE